MSRVARQRVLSGAAYSSRRPAYRQSLDDDHAVPAIDGPGAVGLLNFKVKDGRFADALGVQLGKALLQHRQVQRAQALVVVGTVWVLGVAARAGIEIVQADHRAAAAAGGDGIGDFVG